MIRRLIERSVEPKAIPRLIRGFLRLSAIPIAIGVIAAGVSFAYRGFEPISALFPELLHLDSVYIESRGFPFAQWATNDPENSGFGELRSAFLPSGIFANFALFSALAFFVITLVSLLLSLGTYLRGPDPTFNIDAPSSTIKVARPVAMGAAIVFSWTACFGLAHAGYLLSGVLIGVLYVLGLILTWRKRWNRPGMVQILFLVVGHKMALHILPSETMPQFFQWLAITWFMVGLVLSTFHKCILEFCGQEPKTSPSPPASP